MAEVMVDEYGRLEPPHAGGEVATLLGFLDYQRATLEWKCRGPSDEQLRVALRPSSMTLGGLVKHLACVEDSWFTDVVAGEPLPEPWASVDFRADPEWTWHSAASDPGAYLWALWTEGSTGSAPSCRHSSAGAKKRRWARRTPSRRMPGRARIVCHYGGSWCT
jgi:uncharacterized protein DUF664